MKQFFWKFVHNAMAHPLLVTGTEWSFRFHDWTADQWDKAAAESEFRE